MKVLALLFVLASCTPKEAPVATEPQAVETTTVSEEATTTEEAPAEVEEATTEEAHNHAE